jgi:hypothetical protein
MNGNTNNKRFISETKDTFRSDAEFDSFKPKNHVHHNIKTSTNSQLVKSYLNGKPKTNGDSTHFYQKQHHPTDDKLHVFSGKKVSNDAPYLNKNYAQTTTKHYNYNNLAAGRHENESLLF